MYPEEVHPTHLHDSKVYNGTEGVRRLLVVRCTLPWKVAMNYDSKQTIQSVNPADVEWTYSLRGCHLHSFNTKHLDKHNSIYFGLIGSIETPHGESFDVDDLPLALRTALVKDLSDKKRCIAVIDIPKKTREDYRGYCMKELLPILLYTTKDLVSLSEPYSSEPWLAYVKACRAFTDSVLKVYDEQDIVWVHDYQMLLVPGMIRERHPNSIIGLFIHKPFPSSEIFRCLPSRREVLRGMLGANVIGFHVHPHARHFISSCSRILGIEKTGSTIEIGGRVVHVQSTVITADEEEIMNFLSLPNVQEKIKGIKKLHKGKKVIIGIDKGYQLSSVVDKLGAFYGFLKLYPYWSNKVILIQVTLPYDDDKQERLRTRISQLESMINSEFGSIESSPLIYHYRYLCHEEYYSLLAAADIGLFTPTKTGLSVTVFEYITCQKENKGPLIISEFMGTAGLFPASARVNPSDYDEVAEALNNELSSSDEDRAIKYDYLYDSISNKSRGFWMHTFLSRLDEIANQNLKLSQKYRNIYSTNVFESYRAAKKRLFMLDYDGTLVDICKNPDEAVPSNKLMEALRILSQSDKNEVYIVSGRDTAFLQKQFSSIKSLGLSSEHGCFIKRPNNTKWVDLSKGADYSWKNDVNDIFCYYTERTSGSRIEHKQCSIVWHYRNADPEFGEFQANQCKEQLKSLLITYSNIEVISGKKNIEVRPTLVSKGNVANILVKIYYDSSKSVSDHNADLIRQENDNHLIKDMDISSIESLIPSNYDAKCHIPVNLDFVLCAGDDRTDEDMFNTLAKIDPCCNVFCCHVGSPNESTAAKWNVLNPASMNNLIILLSKIELEIR